MQFVETYKHEHPEPRSKHANVDTRWYKKIYIHTRRSTANHVFILTSVVILLCRMIDHECFCAV